MAERLEFSEFTFGFALTENFGRRNSVKGVPVFPSLTEEGGKAGGYDVAIDVNEGLPLLLQFKVPQVITRRSALMPSNFPRPYYRAHLRCRVNDEGYSQHSVLLEHERNGYDVFYATPRFHRIATLDDLFASARILEESAFFTPTDVGDLTDEPHHVAYCSTSDEGWLRSTPVKLPYALTADEFSTRLEGRLAAAGGKVNFGSLLESMVVAAEEGIAKAEKEESRHRPSHDADVMVKSSGDPEAKRLPPRELVARIRRNRTPRQAAALFARLWLNSELIVVTEG